MAPTEANRRFYAKGKDLWDGYQDISDTEDKGAFLDRLIEDDRLAMTYAGGFFGRNELVDLEDDGDNDEVRYRLAEGIRRGREHARSTIAHWKETGELDTARDSETDSRERSWYTSWLVLGGSDIDRRSSLPSILAATSSGTEPLSGSASSASTSTVRASDTTDSPSLAPTPRTLDTPRSTSPEKQSSAVRPKTRDESGSHSFDASAASASSASMFTQPQSTMTRPSIDTGSSRTSTTIAGQQPPSLRSLARWTCCAA